MKSTYELREWVKWVIFIAFVYFMGVWLLNWTLPEVTLPSIIWDGVCK
jgi:hypothetical protein